MTVLNKKISGVWTVLLLLYALSGCSATELVAYQLWPNYPRVDDDTIRIEGLAQPVKILFDKAGVPHISASNEADLLFAVGMMQGRDRFFGMDTLRRVARGSLSSLVGDQPMLDSTTVQFDLTMRGWGLNRLAEQDVQEVDPKMRALLQHFVDGINYGRQLTQPLEYRLLGVDAEAWTLADSFAVGRLNAWSISHNWSQELTRFLLALSGGLDRAEQLYPSTPWPGSVALELDKPVHELPPGIVNELRDMLEPRPAQNAGSASTLTTIHIPDLPQGASNAWVLAGTRSNSGKPMLANDPHLSHLLPSLVYQQHIKAPGLDVMGVTMAGLPYILMGHNREVAWGMTSAVADVIDLCIEKQNPENPNEVLGPQGWYKLSQRSEEIKVREGAQFSRQQRIFRSSRNGVLLNDLYPELLPKNAPLLAVRWDTSGTGHSLAAIRASNRAHDVFAFREALGAMVTPINVYNVADVHGHYGLFSNGKVPRREHYLGTFPVPGWLDRYQWSGFVDYAQMPASFDSPQGFYAHGNTLMWDPQRSDFIYQIDSAPAYRRDRIVDMIKARPKHDLDSMAKIQNDLSLYRARHLLPIMLKDLDAQKGWSPLEKRALQKLRRWDYVARVESVPASVFWETYRLAAVAASRDEVDASVLPFLLSRRYFINAIDRWYDRADHPAWDDRHSAKHETRAMVLRVAFHQAVANLRKQLGDDVNLWHWGSLHQLAPRHLMGKVDALASTVNLSASDMGGGPDSVWKTHFELGLQPLQFKTTAGPVYRMLIDMKDPMHGRWIIDSGASGWPLSPHYGDQYQRLVHGQYFAMNMNWAELEQQAEGVLSLMPK